MSSQARISGRAKRWPVLPTVLGAVLAVAGIIAYLVLAPPGPERIRDRAVRALEAGDAAGLCRLADREELTKLNVTPQAVSGLLGETLWRNGGRPRHSSRSKPLPMTRDLSISEYQFPGGNSGYARVVVKVIDTPKIGWKLNLTSLLRSACSWSAGPAGGPAKYRELARKYGIQGLRQQEGDYTSLAQMEARAARALGSGR